LISFTRIQSSSRNVSGLSPDALCRNMNDSLVLLPREQFVITWISNKVWIFVLTQSKNCHQRHGLH
jgi:hypothetical protein